MQVIPVFQHNSTIKYNN